MFWIQNRQALAQGQPQHLALISALEQTKATTEIQFYSTATGDYSLSYKGIKLHSMQGAAAEATETVQKSCKPLLGRAHLLIGLGLGYVLDAAFQHSPGYLVVYEPDLPLLKFILENIDLTEYFSSGRVWLTTNVTDTLAVLRPITASEDPLDILALPGYARLLHTQIPPLMGELFSMVEERVRDFKTGQHFHEQWTRQFFQNVSHFAKTIPFENISAQYQGKPALIIGRGPSLDSALEDIKALADSVTLIAAGSALRRLAQAQITPDFAVFYDANGIKEQLHELPEEYLQQIVFFISPFTEARCFEAPSKAKVLIYPQSGEIFAEWLTQSELKTAPFASPLLVEGGGTVSLLAMQLAQALQSSEIILIGQDLAFPNNKVYAGGVRVQQDAEGRLVLDHSEALFTAPEAMATVPGQNGEALPALKAYASFIRHFERLAEENAKQPSPTALYNASLGGATIQGYTLKPLAEFRGHFAPFKQNLADIKECNSLNCSNETATETIRIAISKLRQALHQAIQLHEATLPGQSATDKNANQALYDFLNQHTLISHFLMFEMMATQQRYNPNAHSPEGVASNQALLQQSTQNCIEILRNQILPQVIHAEREITSQVEGARCLQTAQPGH